MISRTIITLVASLGVNALAAEPPASSPTAPAGDKAKQAEKAPPLYDESAEVKALIDSAVERAKKDNKCVLIQWGGNWCGWCIRLHKLCTTDQEIARKLLYEYEVVHTDAGRPEGKNLDLAQKYGADLAKNGFPYLTILDGDGKVLANQDTGSLELKGAKAHPWHDAAKVKEFLTKHQATPLNAKDVLASALSEARESGRSVFLHFGAPWCGWCKRMEAWMDQPEIKNVLAKDFIDVKIDIDRMEGGKDILSQFNPKSSGGIPWFVILDAEGKPIIDSVGPKGNVGFPAQPEEIEHFSAMLKKAAKNISPEEIQAICQSLEKKK